MINMTKTARNVNSLCGKNHEELVNVSKYLLNGVEYERIKPYARHLYNESGFNKPKSISPETINTMKDKYREDNLLRVENFKNGIINKCPGAGYYSFLYDKRIPFKYSTMDSDNRTVFKHLTCSQKKEMENVLIIQITPEKLKQEIISGIRAELAILKADFQPKEPTEYMTRDEVKRLLNVDLSTVHNWTKRGKLKAYGLGNRVYYKRSEVEAAIQPIK